MIKTKISLEYANRKTSSVTSPYWVRKEKSFCGVVFSSLVIDECRDQLSAVIALEHYTYQNQP